MDKLKYIKLKNEDGTYTNAIPLAVDSDHVDIGGDTLTSKLNTLATKTEVAAVASGAPKPVSSISQMTDTTKVYVNTTDGNWYYYNGSSWVSGGVYQATGISQTNIELDGRNVKSSHLPFNYGIESFNTLENIVQGGITGNVGDTPNYNTDTSRARTELTTGNYKLINFNPSFYDYLYSVIDLSTNLILSVTAWRNDNIFDINVAEGTKVILQMRHHDNSAITLNEAETNFRLFNGSINYNIPKIVSLNPIEIDSYNHTITFKAKTMIVTPFKLYNFSDDVTISYTRPENGNVYLIILNTVTNQISVVNVNNRPTNINYIILGYFTGLWNRLFEINIDTEIIMNGLPFKNDKFYLNNNDMYPLLNIPIDANGIQKNDQSATRISTCNYFNFDGSIKVKNKRPDIYRFGISAYTKNGDSYSRVYDSTWKTETFTQVLDTNLYYGVMFAKIDNSSLTIQDVIENFEIINIKNDVLKLFEKVKNSNMRAVAHQGYSGTSQPYGNNKISSYINASKLGFDLGECDLVFSSDNVAMCCHDAQFTDSVTGQTIVIADYTAEQLKQFNYYGETIATFEEVLATCKTYGLGLQIDHVTEADSGTRFEDVMAIVKKYGMQDNVQWNCGRASMITKLLNWNKRAVIGLYLPSMDDLEFTVNLINQYSNDFNRFYITVNYSIMSIENIIAIREALPIDTFINAWTIDNEETYLNYLPYVEQITSNKLSPYIIETMN